MTEPLGINDLTPELHLRFMSYLDIPSLLSVSQTCSLLEQGASMSEIWISRFNSIWPNEHIDDLFAHESRKFARHAMMRRPRVRLDGAYIAQCVYSRRVNEGESLSDPRTYMQIVYHRMIRFLPNNTAYMLLMEKGSKSSARDAFMDLLRGDHHTELLDKHKQLNRCKWHVVNNDDDDSYTTINLTYYDGQLCWGAKVQVCSGSSKRQPGSKMMWLQYKFWDPKEVAEFRRRELFRERQEAAADLQRAQIRQDEEWVNHFVNRLAEIAANLQDIQEIHEDQDMDQVPDELTREIKLRPEHFPMMRFGYSSVLAHLF